MADAKASEEDDATTLTGTEFWAGVQSAGDVKITAAQIKTYVGGVTSVAASVPSFLSVAGSPITTTGTLAISLSGTALPVANGGTGGTSASAARTALSAAGLSQTDECIAGYIGTPSAKTYKIVVKAPHTGTITETTTICESGSGTATFKINTTALGGTANAVSTSEQSQAQASSNAFSAGDDIQITMSGLSSCVGMSFSIKYTRTLAA